jgi:hypothetical protein
VVLITPRSQVRPLYGSFLRLAGNTLSFCPPGSCGGVRGKWTDVETGSAGMGGEDIVVSVTAIHQPDQPEELSRNAVLIFEFLILDYFP